MQTYKKALDLALPVVGENHPTTFNLYYNMGNYYEARENNEWAYEYYRKSYDVSYELYGRHHDSTVRTVAILNERTFVEIAKGKNDEVPKK